MGNGLEGLSETERDALIQRQAGRVSRKLHAAGAAGLSRSQVQRVLQPLNAAAVGLVLKFLDDNGLLGVQPPILKPRGWGVNKPGRLPTVYVWNSDAIPDELWPKAEKPEPEARPKAPTTADAMAAMGVILERMAALLDERLPAKEVNS